MREPREAVAAEVTLEDPPVGRPVEDRAPLLQLPDPFRRLLRVELGHPPLVEHLPATHRVAEVRLPVVLGPHVAHRGRDTALSHDGVRLAEQALADDRDAGALLVRFQRRAQARSARADDHDVVRVRLRYGRRR